MADEIKPDLEPVPPIGPGDPRTNPPKTPAFDSAVDTAAGWLKSHKISAHTVTLAVTAAAIVWASNSEFRTAIQHYWGMIPPQVHAILVGAWTIGTIFYKSLKKENQ